MCTIENCECCVVLCWASSCRYSEEEISRKVSVYRQMLMENLQNTATTTSSSSAAVEKDEAGRPMYVASDAAVVCLFYIQLVSEVMCSLCECDLLCYSFLFIVLCLSSSICYDD